MSIAIQYHHAPLVIVLCNWIYRPHIDVTRSLSSTSIYPTMVTQRSQSWLGMIDSYPFCAMSINPRLPAPVHVHVNEIRLFQTLTFNLKLQGQVHRCGQRAQPYHWPSIYLIWFSFVSYQSDNNSWATATSKFDLEKSQVKFVGEVKGHIVDPEYAPPFRFRLTLRKHIRH